MPSKEDVPIKMSDREVINSKGNTHLLFIAITEYKNGISQLNNPVRDAKSVANCLLRFYNLDRKYLRKLYNKDAHKEAIRNQFKKYLKELRPEDNLILFFSGHGYYDKETGRGYWMTADSTAEKVTTFYSNSEVLDFIRALKIRHFYGVVDSCFSGSFFTAKGDESLMIRNYNDLSRRLLTSGRLEIVDDGPIKGHSPFVEVFLKILKNQKEKYLRASELSLKVQNDKKFNSLKQRPRGDLLKDVGDNGGDFILLRKGQELPILKLNTDIVHRNERKDINEEASFFSNKPNLIYGFRNEHLRNLFLILENFLGKRDFRNADIATSDILLTAFKGKKKTWLTYNDILSLDIDVFRKIDSIWLKQSENRFGVSPKIQIYKEVRKEESKLSQLYFFKVSELLGWVDPIKEGLIYNYQDLNFTLTAPLGHLPSFRFMKTERQLGVGWGKIWESTILALIDKYKQE